MNAETLIGTVLGTCTLQKLIGQGGMGAVFLAQQSRPRRQVAVKVLLPAMALTVAQKAAFLERFRRETDAAASLDHPNILPVHEYGEREGLAYLVMPYVSGGTLSDELEREGQLPLPVVMLYLEQIAAALQVAHESNVIHRDIKPANILMTPEKRLLLSDFGLVKIVSEGETPQTRLTRAGAPIGTPDYMSPEQVIGNDVDARADIYSLGVVLYHMITGETPFKGEMAMQIAVQHLQVPAPSLRQLRPDLPPVAEQVVLRALAKRPEDRYAYARDLASAFRAALTSAGVPLGETPLLSLHVNNARNFTPRGLFDPSWQTGKAQDDGSAEKAAPLPKAVPARPAMPVAPPRPHPVQHQQANGQAARHVEPPPAQPMPPTPKAPSAGMLPQMSQVFSQISEGGITTKNDIVAKTSMTIPSMTGLVPPPEKSPSAASATASKPRTNSTPLPPTHSRLGVRPRLLRPISDAGNAADAAPAETKMPEVPTTPVEEAPTASTAPTADAAPGQGMSIQSLSPSPMSKRGFSPLPGVVSQKPQSSEKSAEAPNGQPRPGITRNLGMSSVFNQEGSATRKLGDSLVDYPTQGANSTMRLTQSMRVVKMPVAGQPGRYVTGLLPTLPKTPAPTESTTQELVQKGKVFVQKNRKPLSIFSLVLVVILLSSFVLLMQGRAHQNTRPTQVKVKATPNLVATGTAQAVATAEANTIFVDPLNQNTHNWTVSTNTKGLKQYAFMDGAYHITAVDANASAISLLTQDEPLPGSFVYTLNMTEITGNDNTVNNQFGMILRFNIQKKNGRNVTTFYAFEVVNAKGGEYQFWKYDDSVQGVSPWTKIWSRPYGPEYHFAHGPYGMNTFRVSMKGPKFSFTVNKKQVGATQDNSLTSGQIGMLVNWYKTEVAFSNLLVTYN